MMMQLVKIGGSFSAKPLEFFKKHERKYLFLMFYPRDFTFVCPTEVLELNSMVKDFEALDCDVYAVSSDSPYCHKAWLKSPTSVGGLGGMVENLTLVSDEELDLARFFGAERDRESGVKRASVLYDRVKEEVIMHSVYPDDVGRDLKEVLRVLNSVVQLEGKPDHYCPKKSLTPLRKSL